MYHKAVEIYDKLKIQNNVHFYGPIIVKDCTFLDLFSLTTDDKNPRFVNSGSRLDSYEYSAQQKLINGERTSIVEGLSLVGSSIIGNGNRVGSGAVLHKPTLEYELVVRN